MFPAVTTRAVLFTALLKKNNQPDKPDGIKIEVIQGTVGSLYAQYALPPIELETTAQSGLQHLDGTLSMARDEPNTAQYEFLFASAISHNLTSAANATPMDRVLQHSGALPKVWRLSAKFIKHPQLDRHSRRLY